VVEYRPKDLKISDRFQVKQKLGQGTFSFIYQAFDKKLGRDMALKVEKKDKNKNILCFEFSVLNSFHEPLFEASRRSRRQPKPSRQNYKHICRAYEYVDKQE